MTFNERAKKIFSCIWDYLKAAWIELVVFAGVLVLDLIVKAVVGATMTVGQSIEIIPKFFSITYTRNYNAAFGSAFGLEKILGKEGVRIALLIITGIAIAFFAVFLVRTKGKHITGRLGLAMLVSGAFGNFINRLFLGYVRDFIEIIYFGLDIPWLGTSFAIFNIADIGVTVGVVLFLVYIIFFSDLAKGADKEEEEKKSEYILLDGETNENADTSEKSADASAESSEQVENLSFETDDVQASEVKNDG